MHEAASASSENILILCLSPFMESKVSSEGRECVHVDACATFCAALCSHELFTFLQLCACSGISVGLTDQDLVRFKAIKTLSGCTLK